MIFDTKIKNLLIHQANQLKFVSNYDLKIGFSFKIKHTNNSFLLRVWVHKKRKKSIEFKGCEVRC